MNYKKNFRIGVTARVLLILLTAYLLVKAENMALLWTSLFLIGAILYQTYLLIGLVEKTNREMEHFLNAIRYDDFSQTYQLAHKGESFERLGHTFNQVISHFKRVRAEKESEYQFLKNIIHHIGIGVLAFDKKGHIHVANLAAKRLFGLSHLQKIEELEAFSADLVQNIRNLHTGAKSLIRIEHSEGPIQLTIYAIEFYLKSEEIKLITVQDIHRELEEQELKAWQNLIRVLTHEIMNSVTPISSLAQTIESEVEAIHQSGELTLEDLEDVQLAVGTIRNRSANLIHFVNQFRSLSQAPEPVFSHVRVKELIEQVARLMRPDCQKASIELRTKIHPPSLMITADPALIEQVLINLVKNALQALIALPPEDPRKREIEVYAYTDAYSRPLIQVKDNAGGIEKEAMERIFIPFFSTKEGGSGVGLSLSRYIMRQHKGNISVRSDAQEGTTFQLKF